MMTHTSTDRPSGYAPIIALATIILVAFATIAVMIESPATLPTWCLTHGCP